MFILNRFLKTIYEYNNVKIQNLCEKWLSKNEERESKRKRM